MNTHRLLQLLKAKCGEPLSEDDDPDVNYLVGVNYLTWDDDAQTHRTTAAGELAIYRAGNAADPGR